jgi:hypothetical protein
LPNELRNNRLINLWNRIPDILLELLTEPAIAGEVEQELRLRFGENGQENFLTFLRCLHGVALPVEGEFSAFHAPRGPDDCGEVPPTYADCVTIRSIMRSMCTFRRWRRVEKPNDWVGKNRIRNDLEAQLTILNEEYERGAISLETLEKLTGGHGFKTRPSRAEIMEEEKRLLARKSSPKIVQSNSSPSVDKNGKNPTPVS